MHNILTRNISRGNFENFWGEVQNETIRVPNTIYIQR